MPNSSASLRDAARSGELPRAMARSGERLGGPRAPAATRHEGWMVRYGRRKIGRSFFHTRYFVLDNKLLAYYKRKPKDNMVLPPVNFAVGAF
jgi:hypothetical protein